MTRRTITRAFRRRMFRDAAITALVLAVALVLLERFAGSKHFALAALVLIPVGAMTFNIVERRAYTAEQMRRRTGEQATRNLSHE